MFLDLERLARMMFLTQMAVCRQSPMRESGNTRMLWPIHIDWAPMRTLVLWSTIAIGSGFISASTSQAQDQTSGMGALGGFVVDSIRGGLLRSATVVVEGTSLSAVTDSGGRFLIDSVPAGMRSLRIIHPFLDTLGIGVLTAPKLLQAGQALSFIAAVPSAQTIARARCSAKDTVADGSALIGLVTDADTEMPSSGARVVVEWTDYKLGSKSIEKTPQRRVGDVRVDGSYLVCGIPADLVTGIFAERGVDSTAQVTVDFGRRLVLQSFVLPHSQPRPAGVNDSAASSRPRGSAVVTGTVLNAAGKPIIGARVSIEADQVAVVTGADGTFALRGARAGTRSVTIRKLGFEPQEVVVTASNRTATVLDVQLTKPVQTLQAIRVSALRDIGLQKVGFTERQKWGMGKMFTPADIERRNPLRLNYLLETAPMLRARVTSDGKRFITGRGWAPCIRYYLDGHLTMEYSPVDLEMLPDSYLSTAELGAVEVYDKVSAPGEFIATSKSGMVCSVVLIWTKWKLGIR